MGAGRDENAGDGGQDAGESVARFRLIHMFIFYDIPTHNPAETSLRSGIAKLERDIPVLKGERDFWMAEYQRTLSDKFLVILTSKESQIAAKENQLASDKSQLAAKENQKTAKENQKTEMLKNQNLQLESANAAASAW